MIDFHEDVYEALTDFLVVSVGLTEAIRRCYGALDDELPYVGVGVFGRLRDLLSVAKDGEWVAARAVIQDCCEQEIAKDPSRERHIADVRWATTFLLPVGPTTAAGDKERLLHDLALPNTVKFGDFGVHACGLAAGDLDTSSTSSGATLACATSSSRRSTVVSTSHQSSRSPAVERAQRSHE